MERNYSIDFLKFFAIFAVVIIHTNPFEGVVLSGRDISMLDSVLDTLARFAVPLFFVISGFLFSSKLTKIDEKKKYVKGYTLNLVKLYISWVVFYLLYDLISILIPSLLRNENFYENVYHYVNEVWSFSNFFYWGESTSGGHLWYLTALIWSVIIIYFFYRFNKINFLLAIGLGLNIFGILSRSLPERDALFFGLFYTCLGFVIAINKDYIVKLVKPKLFIGVSFLLLLFQLVERKFLFGGEYYFSTILLTIFLFSLALKYSRFGKGTVLAKVGGQSVGVYVIHVFFIKLSSTLIAMFDLNSLQSTVIWHLLFTPFIFVVSYFSYNALQTRRRIKWKRIFNKQATVSS